jgi:MFS transporter, putative metabolite:H+ symporter
MSSNHRYGAFLDSLPMNSRHWRIFGVCAAGFAFDALDFQIMALVAPTIAKEWNIDASAMGFVLAATVAGMLVGSYLFGTISDRIGRRLGFQLTVAIFSLFCGLSAFAQTPEQLAILRFLTGVGIGGLVPIDTAVMTEFMPKAQRGRLMALWALFFPVGGLIAALAAKLVVADLGWRALFLIGAAPAALVLVVRVLIPESPRFLLDRGRIDEARRAMSWLALGRPLPDHPAPARSAPEASLASVTIGTLFSPLYRRRTIMIWLVWFGWGFSYFGVLLWLPSLLVQHRGVAGADVFTFVMGFMVAGIVGRIVVSFLVERWGRKTTIGVFGIASAVALIAFGQQTSYANLVVFGYLFAFFHDGGLSAIAPYTPELYPTRSRATGVGYANGAGRIASILSPIAVGFLVPFGLTLVFALLAAGYLLAAVVVLSFNIETRGLVLEDAALDGVAPVPQAAPRHVDTRSPA